MPWSGNAHQWGSSGENLSVWRRPAMGTDVLGGLVLAGAVAPHAPVPLVVMDQVVVQLELPGGIGA